MKRFVRWLKRPVELNAATVIFCFLEGAALSIPTSVILLPINPFEPHKLVSDFCVLTAWLSALMLPFGSAAMLGNKEKGLATLGFVTVALFFLGGLLFPAIS